MIEAEQTVLIDIPIEGVWEYVKDIRRWANLMPGMRECTVIDADHSRWTLKVGVGGLARTVNVLVHIDQWDGPGRVKFSYRLEGDPVEGGGAYVASRKGARETQVTLTVRVKGGGPMAPMWEAMSKPLLPQLAKGFAGQLKAQIEKAAVAGVAQEVVMSHEHSRLAAIRNCLRSLWRAIFRPETERSPR